MSGKDVLQLAQDMRLLHTQIADLLGTADDLVSREGWKWAQSGVPVHAFLSGSIDVPKQWMPSEFFRFYKHDAKSSMLAFVAVVLLPHANEEFTLEEPVVTAGWFSFVGKSVPTLSVQNLWYCRWHLYSKERKLDGLIKEARVADYPRAEVEKYGYSFDRARTLAVPLAGITAAAELESRVIKPLLADMRENAPSTV